MRRIFENEKLCGGFLKKSPAPPKTLKKGHKALLLLAGQTTPVTLKRWREQASLTSLAEIS